MSTFSLESFWNSTFVEVLRLYWGNFLTYFSNLYQKTAQSETFSNLFQDLPDSLNFDDFQWNLLKVFIFILLLNLLLIFVTWRVYRKNVCERFMRPVTSKAIEELKASVSRLKLPKEHTPRI